MDLTRGSRMRPSDGQSWADGVRRVQRRRALMAGKPASWAPGHGRSGRHGRQRPGDLLCAGRRHGRHRRDADGQTKKFNNVEAGSRVAFVVDIVDTSEGWHPIYLEIRGTAEALARRRPARRWLPPRDHQDPPGLGALVQPATSMSPTPIDERHHPVRQRVCESRARPCRRTSSDTSRPSIWRCGGA